MSQRNRAEKRLSGQWINWWEGQYFAGKERVRREAKRLAHRIQRRLDKVVARLDEVSSDDTRYLDLEVDDLIQESTAPQTPDSTSAAIHPASTNPRPKD